MATKRPKTAKQLGRGVCAICGDNCHSIHHVDSHPENNAEDNYHDVCNPCHYCKRLEPIENGAWRYNPNIQSPTHLLDKLESRNLDRDCFDFFVGKGKELKLFRIKRNQKLIEEVRYD